MKGKLLIGILVIIILMNINGVNGYIWSNSTFNNSLTSETLAFDGGTTNFTRWLEIPAGVDVITNGLLDGEIIRNHQFYNETYLDVGGKKNVYLWRSQYIDKWDDTSINTRLWRLFSGTMVERTNPNPELAIYDAGSDGFLRYNLGNPKRDFNMSYRISPTGAGVAVFIRLTNNTEYGSPDSRSNYISLYEGDTTNEDHVLWFNFTAKTVKIKGITSGTKTHSFSNMSDDGGKTYNMYLNFGTTSSNGENQFLALRAPLTVFDDYTGMQYFTMNEKEKNQTFQLVSYINDYVKEQCVAGQTCRVPFNFTSSNNANFDYTNLIFTNDGFYENDQTFNSTTIETKTETFMLNLTYQANLYLDVNAKLNYNQILHDGIKTGTIYDNTTTFYKTISVPLVSPSKDFWWEVSMTYLNGTTRVFNSTIKTQTVTSLNFTNSKTYPVINFSFINEDTLNKIDGSITSGTIKYSLDPTMTIYKTITPTFNNQSLGVFQFPFSISPTSATPVYTSWDFKYFNGTNYPQRNFVNSSIILTNNTLIEKPLYMTSSSDGIYVTFQVQNVAEQVLEGVSVVAMREISGETVIIESGTTGADGGITFFLNPDYQHTFTFTRAGYDTFTSTITPTQSLYTITMSVSSQAGNTTNFYEGILFNTYPTDYMLVNNTDYVFSFNISSTYWSLQKAGFTLTNSSGSFIGASSCTTSSGCNSWTHNNTANYSYIVMNYYWIVNGSESNGTQYWFVGSSGAGEEASLTLFKRDFEKLGISFGTGGEADFTRALISFFIILLTVGTVCYISGIYSPSAILGMIFFMTLLLNQIGMIPRPFGSVPYFIPIIVGLIFIINFLYEYTR